MGRNCAQGKVLSDTHGVRGSAATCSWGLPAPCAWGVVVKPPAGNVIVPFPARPDAFTGQTGTRQDTDCPKILETSPKPWENLLG